MSQEVHLVCDFCGTRGFERHTGSLHGPSDGPETKETDGWGDVMVWQSGEGGRDDLELDACPACTARVKEAVRNLQQDD